MSGTWHTPNTIQEDRIRDSTRTESVLTLAVFDAAVTVAGARDLVAGFAALHVGVVVVRSALLDVQHFSTEACRLGPGQRQAHCLTRLAVVEPAHVIVKCKARTSWSVRRDAMQQAENRLAHNRTSSMCRQECLVE